MSRWLIEVDHYYFFFFPVSVGAYRRISGSCLGGGSFFGLCKLLTGQRDFENIIEMSRKGDVQNVDLLVSDIYGA